MKSLISLILAGVLASSVVYTESLTETNSATDAASDVSLLAHSPPPRKPCLRG
jgi:Flp pilus assembly protein TadG